MHLKGLTYGNKMYDITVPKYEPGNTCQCTHEFTRDEYRKVYAFSLWSNMYSWVLMFNYGYFVFIIMLTNKIISFYNNLVIINKLIFIRM